MTKRLKSVLDKQELENAVALEAEKDELRSKIKGVQSSFIAVDAGANLAKQSQDLEGLAGEESEESLDDLRDERSRSNILEFDILNFFGDFSRFIFV